ncbi:hypothetical protein [Olivibacter domesticus]|nr:hypothetical protein [Olivibacter domesticus]
MEVQARNIVIRLFFLLLFISVFKNTAIAQQAIKSETQAIEDEIYTSVNKSFRFRWSNVFSKADLRHHFFSLKFLIGPNGCYTDIQPSAEMDTAIFSRSIERVKEELPKDVFKKMKISNTSVVFPVFVFAIPQDTPRFDFDGEKIKENPDTLRYDSTFEKSLSNLWEYERGMRTLHDAIVFPPIIHFIKRGIPDIKMLDPKQLKKKNPFSSNDMPTKLKN